MPYPLATLVLNVTNKCNLSCTYCYEFGADRSGINSDWERILWNFQFQEDGKLFE